MCVCVCVANLVNFDDNKPNQSEGLNQHILREQEVKCLALHFGGHVNMLEQLACVSGEAIAARL